MMPIYVISLRFAEARRESVIKQFENINVPFSFIDAFNGEEGREFFDEYNKVVHLFNNGRLAVSSEFGCYASHLSAWKKCIEMNRPIVVLEDDIALQDDFTLALNMLEPATAKYGFIRMEPQAKSSIKISEDNSNFSVHYCTRFMYGAAAYAISPAVAKAFVQKSKCFISPVDGFIKQFWFHKQPLYVLKPFCAQPGDLGKDSYIEASRNQVKPLKIWFKPLRQLYKITQYVKRYMFNLKFHTFRN